jgi:hypothetical protein
VHNQLPRYPNRRSAVTSSSPNPASHCHLERRGFPGHSSLREADATLAARRLTPSASWTPLRPLVRECYRASTPPDHGRHALMHQAEFIGRACAFSTLMASLTAEGLHALADTVDLRLADARQHRALAVAAAYSRERVTARRGRPASSKRAVTCGTAIRIVPISLALPPDIRANAACRNNDAFPQYRFYPLRLRQSRAPCQAPLAHTQRLLSATTQPGRETRFTVCSTALPYQSTQEENHPPSNLRYRCRSAAQIAYRLAPARALAARRFMLYLASMSQPRSSVLVTPQLTTVSRVDLNTYLFVAPSSKQSRTGRCRH